MSEIQIPLATLHFYLLNLAILVVYPFCHVPKPGVLQMESGWLMKTGSWRKQKRQTPPEIIPKVLLG